MKLYAEIGRLNLFGTLSDREMYNRENFFYFFLAFFRLNKSCTALVLCEEEDN